MSDIVPEIEIVKIIPPKPTTLPEQEIGRDRNLGQEIISNFREKLQIPPAAGPDGLGVMADRITRDVIENKRLNKRTTRMALAGSSLMTNFFNRLREFEFEKATTGLPPMPVELVEPLNKEEDFGWPIYSRFFLNGNLNVFSTSEKELPEWKRKSRFYQEVAVNRLPVSNQELKNYVFEVFRETNDDGGENTKAFPWETDKGTKHSYGLGIRDKKDLLFLDIADGATLRTIRNSKIYEDAPEFQDKLVVIRDGNGEWQGEREREILSELLDRNKAVLYVIDGNEKRGIKPYIQIIVNHNWGDAMQFDHALTRLGEEFLGRCRQTDTREAEKILYQCNTRYNFGENRANGAVRSWVLDQNDLKQLNDLYKSYALEIRELAEKNYHPDKGDKKRFMDKFFLKNGTFIQLLLLDVGGEKGGVLQFDPKRRLRHYEVGEGKNLEELEDALKSGDLAEIEIILDIYNQNNDTMALIEKANAQLSQDIPDSSGGSLNTPLEKAKRKFAMAAATWLSGASRQISGWVLGSYLRITKSSRTIGCPAMPIFIDTAFTANAELGEPDADELRDFKELTVNCKANF